MGPGPGDDPTETGAAAEDTVRLPGTSEVDTAAVEVPSHSTNTVSPVEVPDTAQVELPGFRERRV